MEGVLTVEEARHILGEDAEGMTDNDIREEVTHFENIARLVVRNFKVLKAGNFNSLEVL